MFTIIQFSRNITSAGKDMMLVMVFFAQLERNFLGWESLNYLNGDVHVVNYSQY